jgi:hypothetical protein
MKEGSKKQISRKIKWIEFKIECLEFLLLNGGGGSTRIVDALPILFWSPFLVLVIEAPDIPYKIVYQAIVFIIWFVVMMRAIHYTRQLLERRITKLNKKLSDLQKQINN